MLYLFVGFGVGMNYGRRRVIRVGIWLYCVVFLGLYIFFLNWCEGWGGWREEDE